MGANGVVQSFRGKYTRAQVEDLGIEYGADYPAARQMVINRGGQIVDDPDPQVPQREDVNDGAGDTDVLAALDQVQGVVPADKRSGLARAFDAVFTPPEAITSGAERLANSIDTSQRTVTGGFLDAYSPSALRDVAAGLLHHPIDTLRGAAAGTVEGIGQQLSPGNVALVASGPLGKAAGVAPEVMAAINRLVGVATAARGGERVADAETGSDRAAGVAQVGLGLLPLMPSGRIAAPVARPVRGELPAGARFVAAPDGRVAPAGADIPMTPAPDGSFVRGVPAEYARRESRGALPPGPRFIADEGGTVRTAEQAAEVAPGVDVPASRPPAQSGVRAVPAAVAARDVNPHAKASEAITVKQYSGDVNATDVPFVTPEQRRVLEVMRTDLQEFPGERGRLVRSEGSAVKDLYVRGGEGSPVNDDIRTISGQHVSGSAIISAIDDLLAGKAPTNKLHTAALDAAQGYIEGREGYRGPRLPLDVPVEGGGDAGFEVFSKSLDELGGESAPGGSGRTPGEEGFATLPLLGRTLSGAAGAATGVSTGDPNEPEWKKALRGVAGFAVGAALPEIVRGGRGRAAANTAASVAREIEGRPISLAPNVVADATVLPRQRAARSGEPMRDPLAGMTPLLTKFNPLVRDGIARVIADNNGFADARRGTINTRHLGKFANEVRVSVEQALPKGSAVNAETIAALARAMQQTTTRVEELSTLITSGRATDADILAHAIALQEQKVVAQSFMGARSEAGRTLGALNFWGGVLDSGNVELIRKVAEPLREEAHRIAQGVAALPPDPLIRFKWLQEQQKVPVSSYLRSYYIANLLSGPLTQFRNVLGNLSNALVDTATLPVAAGIDAAKSAIKGTPRTVRLSELPATAAGSLVGLEQGWSDAMFALKNAIHPAELTRSVETAATKGKLDLPSPELPGGGANPLNWSFRAMTAADALARTTAREGELAAILFNQAKNEGRSGQGLLNRVAELRAGMTPEAMALRTQAEQYAARRVFLEQPGEITRRVMHAVQAVPGSYFVLPFMRISSSIAKQGAEFSPLGFMMKAARAEGRAGTQAQARATAGTLAAGYFFWLAGSGRLSGDGPKDPAERAALMERGWRPNSIKFGNTWYGYQTASPLNMPMAAIANAVESVHDKTPASAADAVAQTFARFANTFLESTFLQGAFNAVEALKDPERNAARFFAQTATGLIPASSALRTVQRAMDPVQRRPRGVVENVEVGMPGLSENVEPRIDRFGDVVTRPGGPARRALDPFNASTEVSDPLATELDRLGVKISLPVARLALPAGVAPLTRQEETQLEQSKGRVLRQRLEQFIASPGYAKLSDAVKASRIEALRDAANRAANTVMRNRKTSEARKVAQ